MECECKCGCPVANMARAGICMLCERGDHQDAPVWESIDIVPGVGVLHRFKQYNKN